MKKTLMALGFMGVLLAGAAMADDVPFEFKILGYKENGDQFKVAVSDIQKGVFVQVGHGMAAKHPKAKTLIEETLKKSGIKIAQTVEEADFGLQFDNISNDYLDRIDADAGSDTALGIFVEGTLKNFVFLTVFGQISAMNAKHAIDPEKPIPSIATFTFAKNPKLSWVKIINGDDLKTNTVELTSKINRLGKNGDGFDAKTLVGMVTGYIKTHIDGYPGQPPVAASAPAVAPVATN